MKLFNELHAWYLKHFNPKKYQELQHAKLMALYDNITEAMKLEAVEPGLYSANYFAFGVQNTNDKCIYCGLGEVDFIIASRDGRQIPVHIECAPLLREKNL